MRPTIAATALLLLAVPGLAVGCSSRPDPASGAMQGTAVGVDLEGMDKAIRPGDDFYAYANGKWLASAAVPDDAAAARRSDAAAELTRTRLLAIVQEIAGKPQARGSGEAHVRRFYLSYLDRAGIEKAGRAPVQAELDRISAIADQASLARVIGSEMRSEGAFIPGTDRPVRDGLFGLAVYRAPDGGTVAALVPGGLGLPVAGYGDAGLRAAYRDYVALVLDWSGVTEANALATRVLALETKLAAAREAGDVRFVSADPQALSRRAPGLDWPELLGAAGLAGQGEIALGDPGAVAATAALAGEGDLATWKAWLAFHAVNRVADLLPSRVAAAQARLYGARLGGVPAEPGIKSRAVERIGALYPDVIGRYYATRYIDKAEQRDAASIASQVRAALRRQIEAADWLGEEAKRTALTRLDATSVGVGGPERIAAVVRPRPRGTSAADLARVARRGLYAAALARIGQGATGADRAAQWTLPPYAMQMRVDPGNGAIEIPAPLLQPPYYAGGSDSAAKYGALGAMIGRGLTSAIGDSSAGAGEGGWTEAFAGRRALIRERMAQPSARGPARVDDLLGLVLAYDAYRASLGGKEPQVIEGLTGDQRFFIAFAQMAAVKPRVAGTDVARDTAATVRHVDAWYRAFDVQPGAKLYLAPEQRAPLW